MKYVSIVLLSAALCLLLNTIAPENIHNLNNVGRAEAHVQLAATKKQPVETQRVVAKTESVVQTGAPQEIVATPRVLDDKQTMMQAAGIPEPEWQIADELVQRESSWNPRAVNSSSKSCGLAQELPCGKSGCTFGDGQCSLNWMQRYVSSRYGSWSTAIAHHDAEDWY